MDIVEIKRRILMLPIAERKRMLLDVDGTMAGPETHVSHIYLLDNRMGLCLHGGYVRFDKGT